MNQNATLSAPSHARRLFERLERPLAGGLRATIEGRGEVQVLDLSEGGLAVSTRTGAGPLPDLAQLTLHVVGHRVHCTARKRYEIPGRAGFELQPDRGPAQAGLAFAEVVRCFQLGAGLRLYGQTSHAEGAVDRVHFHAEPQTDLSFELDPASKLPAKLWMTWPGRGTSHYELALAGNKLTACEWSANGRFIGNAPTSLGLLATQAKLILLSLEEGFASWGLYVGFRLEIALEGRAGEIVDRARGMPPPAEPLLGSRLSDRQRRGQKS